GIKDFIVGAFEDVKAWWDTDGALIFDAMGTVVSKVFEIITFVVETSLAFVVDLFNRFAPIVEGIWGVLWPTIQYVAETVWEKIRRNSERNSTFNLESSDRIFWCNER